MKIGILTTQTPFVFGGAELHALSLKTELIKRGFEAEIITMPFRSAPPDELINSMFLWRSADLSQSDAGAVDLAVCLKFPAYYAKHPNKVVWLLHQHREAYELYNKRPGGLADTKEGRYARELIIKNDYKYLSEAKRIFTNSKNVANRLKTYSLLDSTPLYHPPPSYDKLRCNDFNDYVIYISRVDFIKRQHILIEAIRYCKTPVKAIIAGSGNNEYLCILTDLIEKYKLSDRVKLIGAVDEAQKIELYAKCLCVFFAGYDEDYGYVPLEAFFSKKALITLSDCGGALELVRDGVNGFIHDSQNPEDLAKSIDALYCDKHKAKTFGEKGFQALEQLNVNWDFIIDTLLR
ncbi:glycosyltransferase [Candidatus Magnetoovum chiemensis]|nr:glycosyltransferase [Candidatus Magnetoovum chiemensis]